MTGRGEVGINWKRVDLDIRKKIYGEGGETLQQAAQKGHKHPLSGSIQGQTGWGCEQPGLGGCVLAYTGSWN